MIKINLNNGQYYKTSGNIVFKTNTILFMIEDGNTIEMEYKDIMYIAPVK